MGKFEGPLLSNAQAMSLEEIPSFEEVKSAVWACDSSKAPGYDGYNFGFLKRTWDTVGDDLPKTVLAFF